MMHKIVSELLSASMLIRVPKEQKKKEPTESKDRMPAKSLPKINSVIKESPINQKCET